MELRDYLAALRDFWRTGLVTLAVCLALAGAALGLGPRTYSATAGVFVSASPSIANSAQYVVARARTYPGVATSSTVLGPVRDRLGLPLDLADLRGEVRATNPDETSQVLVTVTDRDPRRAAAIANAVAAQLVSAVPDLEKHAAGDPPVQMTVTDPAGVPGAPVSPVPSRLLGLGLVSGLLLGAAAVVVRSRRDTAVRDESDVRAVWAGEPLEVLAPRRGRAARSALTGRPARALARRLETVADRPVRIAVACPAPGEPASAIALAAQTAAELTAAGLPAVAAREGTTPAEDTRVRLDVVDPLSPARSWRPRGSGYDGAVLVVPAGRVDVAELAELRAVLRSVGVPTLALVLVRPHHRRAGRGRHLSRTLSGLLPRRRAAARAA
jgi:capsular polysaccharide biosynthesis protein